MSIENNSLSRRTFSRAIANVLATASLLTLAGSAAGQTYSAKMLPIGLRARGMDPANITVAAGNYRIVLFNRSGVVEALNVEVDQVQAGALTTVASGTIPKTSSVWLKAVTLNTGTYQVKVTGYTYAGWPTAGVICTITVS